MSELTRYSFPEHGFGLSAPVSWRRIKSKPSDGAIGEIFVLAPNHRTADGRFSSKVALQITGQRVNLTSPLADDIRKWFIDTVTVGYMEMAIGKNGRGKILDANDTTFDGLRGAEIVSAKQAGSSDLRMVRSVTGRDGLIYCIHAVCLPHDLEEIRDGVREMVRTFVWI